MELNAVTAAGWLHVLAEEKQQHHIKEALPEKKVNHVVVNRRVE